MQIKQLEGITLEQVIVNEDRDEIIFVQAAGKNPVRKTKAWKMFHSGDCCESVTIDDINGDLDDLIGSPILDAREESGEILPAKDKSDDSFTWTFYRISTIKGTVVIRWYGTSNGYYSENVDFKEVVPINGGRYVEPSLIGTY